MSRNTEIDATLFKMERKVDDIGRTCMQYYTRGDPIERIPFMTDSLDYDIGEMERLMEQLASYGRPRRERR